MRTKSGLPFPVLNLMNLLLKSAIARTQRDHKVTLCHHLWMGNHPHMILLPDDASQCTKFYMEVKKKLTESVKRLTGLEHLTLWEEGGSMVAEILDPEKVKSRIAYLYSNPSRADLVSSIDEYPGLSTWKQFQEGCDSHCEEVKWIRMPYIRKLPTLKVNRELDRMYTEELLQKARKTHDLVVKPNAWMECFGIEDQKDEINRNILERIRSNEKEYEEKRLREKRSPRGAYRLRQAGLSWEHAPKERRRKIFVLSSVTELRVRYIENLKKLSEKCRELYEMVLSGGSVREWPPGMFRPPLPPMASCLS